MTRVRYGGVRDPKALFEELRPFRRRLRDAQDLCRPFGPEYMMLGAVVAALDAAAHYFTGQPAFYAVGMPDA
jgi:hypothetical protein